MSGIEIGIAVVGAAAALISAYKDGGKIIDKIEDRRRQRNIQEPDPPLEESLQEGQEEIEKIRRKGIQSFGNEFGENDDVAVQTLKDLTIEIQSSIIKHLGRATTNDDITNFSVCIDKAVETRLKAVAVLNTLYLREKERRRNHDIKHVQRTSTLQTLPEQPTPARMTATESSSASVQTPRHSWRPWRRSQSTPTGPLSPQPSPNTAALSSRVVSISSSNSERGSIISPLISPPLSPEHARANTISEATNFGGFCKGAYYVEMSLYSKAIEFTPRDFHWVYHCKKCSFELPSPSRQQDSPSFDDSVYRCRSIRFRQLFLFKSHVAPIARQARTGIRNAYQCILCVLAGDTSPQFQSEGLLFEHIANHQGAEWPGGCIEGSLLFNTASIEFATEDSFDVCFDGSTFQSPAQHEGQGRDNSIQQQDLQFSELPSSAIDLNQPSELVEPPWPSEEEVLLRNPWNG